MKVLQINTSVNTGSTGRIAEDLGSLLIDNGNDSHIAFGRTNNHSISEITRIGKRRDILLHVLKSRLYDRHGFGSVGATRNFLKEIEHIDPDLIHLHNIHGYYLNVKLLFDYLKQLQKPVVWTFHDCWPFTGHCSHFQFVECYKWQTVCHVCPNRRAYPESWFKDNSRKNYGQKRELFSGLDKMVLVSPSIWLAETLKNSFLSTNEIKVINNGIDLTRFKPIHDKEVLKKYGLDKQYILGVASAWTDRKGLGDFKKLRGMLDPSIDLVLVGLSAGQLKALPAGIKGILRTDNIDELAALYTASEIFVNPTYVDNFPTVNLEAMACGTPVITYKTGGSPESIDESTGRVIEKGDVMALHAAVQSLQNDGKEVYSTACRKKAEKLYDKNERYGEYLDLYLKMMDNE